MPGYTPKTSAYAPAPTTETKEMKDRFSMPAVPQLTVVQMILAAVIIAYAYTARKVNGPENLFFLPSEGKTEHYCATGACGCGK